jgi:hypothetical protein
MKVTGSDGRRWQVGRRRLAWRPRPHRWLKKLWWVADGLSDPITGLLALIAVIALLPLLVLYLVNWIACLIATPFAWLGRAAFGRPWPVVARAAGDKRGEYWGSADGAAAADALAERVREEISRYGEPRSLTAPPTPPTEPATTETRPIIDRITSRDREHRD